MYSVNKHNTPRGRYEPSDAAERGGTKPREMPQATPCAAAPRTGVKEEKQPHQRGASGLRRPPPAAPTGALALLLAPLFEPSDAAVRGTKPREMPQATPSAAAPRTGVREEQQPHQRGAYGLRWPPAPMGPPVLLRAPLLVPSGAHVRVTKPRETP